jgi:pimeloyl-ACP methyl ester carboxylesterase
MRRMSGVPASRITVRAGGSASAGFQTEVKGEIAGASLGFSGRVRRTDAGFEAEGQGRIGSKDLSPLLQVLALGWPDPQAGAPAEAAADVLVKGGKVEARALSGSLAGVRFNGDVQFAPWESGLRRGLTGALSLDRVSLDALSSAILGPSGASRGALQWSDAPFAPGLASPPPARIELRIGALDLRGGLEAREATVRLDLTPGAMTLDDLSARLGASTVSGRLTLRRDKAELWRTVPASALAARAREIACVDARADLAACQQPALCIVAEQDSVVPVACAEEIARLLPHAETLSLRGGHFALYAEAKRAADAIAEFVASRIRATGGDGAQSA